MCCCPECYTFIYTSTLGAIVTASQELEALRGSGTFMPPQSSVTHDSSQSQHSSSNSINMESDLICFLFFLMGRKGTSMRPMALKLLGGWRIQGATESFCVTHLPSLEGGRRVWEGGREEGGGGRAKTVGEKTEDVLQWLLMGSQVSESIFLAFGLTYNSVCW